MVRVKISKPASPVGTTDYSVGAGPYVFPFHHNLCPCRGRIIHCKRLKYAPPTGASLVRPKRRDRAEALSCNMRPLQGQRPHSTTASAVKRRCPSVKRHCPSVKRHCPSPARLSVPVRPVHRPSRVRVRKKDSRRLLSRSPLFKKGSDLLSHIASQYHRRRRA